MDTQTQQEENRTGSRPKFSVCIKGTNAYTDPAIMWKLVRNWSRRLFRRHVSNKQ
jgi:hypothetical protein